MKHDLKKSYGEWRYSCKQVNDHFHIPVIQRPGKETMLPLDIRMDGPQIRSVHNGKKKIRSDAGARNTNRTAYS